MTTETKAKNYKGFVLATGEYNYHDDSDFYAIVWDEEEGKVKRIGDGTTRFAAPPRYNSADASEEVRETARAWMRDTFLPPYCRVMLENKARNNGKVAVGVTAKVVKGRKVPLGTEGKVFWIGQNGYGSSWAARYGTLNYKVGLALDDERDARGRYANVAWTYTENLEVLPSHAVTDAMVAESAENVAGNFRLVGAGALPFI